jgi:hypothetical protein
MPLTRNIDACAGGLVARGLRPGPSSRMRSGNGESKQVPDVAALRGDDIEPVERACTTSNQ